MLVTGRRDSPLWQTGIVASEKTAFFFLPYFERKIRRASHCALQVGQRMFAGQVEERADRSAMDRCSELYLRKSEPTTAKDQ
jgi:hypothetical protein